MKRWIKVGFIILGSIAFFGIGYLGGKLSSAPPQFTVEPTASGDSMGSAWANFIRAQNEALQILQAHDFYGDEQERAEAHRAVLYTLAGALSQNMAVVPEVPRFSRIVDYRSKSGQDNPDNNYYIALIEDDASYRITGTRGDTAGLVFQLVVGQPAVKGAGTSKNIDVLYEQEMRIDDKGQFEIIVSAENPGDGKNWLKNGPGAESLIVRYTHSDWSQRAGNLFIERIGGEGEAKPSLTPELMAAQINNVASSVFDRTATWLNFAEKVWLMMPRNDVNQPRSTQGGLVGQYSSFGTWDLADDEALVISVPDSGAPYSGIELGNLWFVSLEYDTRTSSLTPEQSYLSSDGRYWYVVSSKDPGIQNWLDTESHRRGLINFRWQGLESLPQGELMARKVTLDKIREALPADVPMFTADQRWQQRAQRRRESMGRFPG